jgi:hypothetical protein
MYETMGNCVPALLAHYIIQNRENEPGSGTKMHLQTGVWTTHSGHHSGVAYYLL